MGIISDVLCTEISLNRIFNFGQVWVLAASLLFLAERSKWIWLSDALNLEELLTSLLFGMQKAELSPLFEYDFHNISAGRLTTKKWAWTCKRYQETLEPNLKSRFRCSWRDHEKEHRPPPPLIIWHATIGWTSCGKHRARGKYAKRLQSLVEKHSKLKIQWFTSLWVPYIHRDESARPRRVK